MKRGRYGQDHERPLNGPDAPVRRCDGRVDDAVRMAVGFAVAVIVIMSERQFLR